MKLKDISRTATFAWSPQETVPLMATGSAAGAIDPDFSSSMSLDLWSLDLLDRSAAALEVTEPVASLDTDARFHDVAFSSDGKHVAGALENGVVDVWSVDTKGKKPKLSGAHHGTAHTGPVKAVAFNRLNPTALASGGANGHVFVWDLNDFDKPTTPGTQSARHDEVEAVAWNNRVPHILASGGNTGFTSIWDLKKRREVIHLHYTSPSGTRVPVSSVAWHPTNSTQLVTGSLDDSDPVVLVWDLRNANSPEKVLRGHQKGVLSVSWCAQDKNLLLSSGKDNRTLLWNPTAGELLGEYPVSVEWTFKTEFHPTLPDLFGSASFDGKVSVQTLQDTVDTAGKKAAVTSKQGDDFWDSEGVLDAVNPQFVKHQAPAWLERPVSATFGFGGKLAILRTQLVGDKAKSTVTIDQIHDNAFPQETADFSRAIKSGSLQDIVDARDASLFDWKLLADVLGKEDLVTKYVPGAVSKPDEDEADDDVFDTLNQQAQYAPTGEYKLLNGADVEVSKLVLNGKLPEAVNKLLSSGAFGDALLLASYGTKDLLTKAQNAYLNAEAEAKPYLRTAWAVDGSHMDDIISHAEIKAWPSVLSAALRSSDKGKQTAHLGKRLEAAGERDNALIVYLTGGNVGKAAALWLAELPTLEKALTKEGKHMPYAAHVKALQQVIEKITVATRSTEPASLAEADEEMQVLYEAYRDYADLVASQGDLELAKIFLDLLPAEYSQEKRRIDYATKSTSTTPAAKQRTAKSVRSNAYAAAPGFASPSPVSNDFGTAASSKPVGPYAPSGATQAHSTPINPYIRTGGSTTPTVANGLQQSFTPAVTNPYAAVAGGAANTAVASVNASRGPHDAPVTPLSPPPSKVAHSGWNDLPEMKSSRRTPIAPQIIAPSFGTPVGAGAPPPAAASRRPSTKATPPPPKAGHAAPIGSTSSSPGGVQSAPPVSHAVPAPPVAPANPYATPPVANAAAAPGAKPNPYAQPSAAPRTKPNPYAPTSSPSSPQPSKAQPTGFGGRPQVAPKPKVAATPPPPPPTGTARVPPAAKTSTAPLSSASPTAPAPSDASTKRKYPAGDRSHIPANAKPIYNQLSAELARIQPMIEAQYPKPYKDTVRRINMLFDHINNDELLEQSTVLELVQLSGAIAAKDFDRAVNIQRDIVTSKSDQCGQWMTGVKRLIDMSRAVPS